jgi:uncharacterized membrane protein
MSLAGIILVLVSATLHVGWNFLISSSSNPRVFPLIRGTAIIGMSAIFLVSIPLHEIPSVAWFYVLLSGFVHALYVLSLSTAYVKGDISYVYPIARSAPAFVPVAAFLIFGETISLRGGAGITVVVLCIFLLQLGGGDTGESRHIFAFIKQRDSLWAFAALATVVTYSLIDKAGMVHLAQVEKITSYLHGPTYFLLEASLSNLIYWGYMASRREFGDRHVWKREWFRGILAALATMSSYSLILHVMKTEHLGYIVTLRQSSILIAVLLGWLVLREKQGLTRLLIAGAMLGGFFLVATAK